MRARSLVPRPAGIAAPRQDHVTPVAVGAPLRRQKDAAEMGHEQRPILVDGAVGDGRKGRGAAGEAKRNARRRDCRPPGGSWGRTGRGGEQRGEGPGVALAGREGSRKANRGRTRR